MGRELPSWMEKKESKAEARARKEKELFIKVLGPVLSKRSGAIHGEFNAGVLDLLPRDYLVELYEEHRGDAPELTDEALELPSDDESEKKP